MVYYLKLKLGRNFAKCCDKVDVAAANTITNYKKLMTFESESQFYLMHFAEWFSRVVLPPCVFRSVSKFKLAKLLSFTIQNKHRNGKDRAVQYNPVKSFQGRRYSRDSRLLVGCHRDGAVIDHYEDDHLTDASQ